MGYALVAAQGELCGFGSLGGEWARPGADPGATAGGIGLDPEWAGMLAPSPPTARWSCRGGRALCRMPQGSWRRGTGRRPGGVAADGLGYYVAVEDGGVYTFGSARFFGSVSESDLNQPIVDMAMRPGGDGYWTLAADGGVFAFGAAPFYGSGAEVSLASPAVSIAATPSGRGYWVATGAGDVLTFGDAIDFGSLADLGVPGPVIGMCSSRQVFGYWMASETGVVRAFGDTYFLGCLPPAMLAPPFAAVRRRRCGVDDTVLPPVTVCT